MKDKTTLRKDQFQLYDLTVVVEKISGNCTCQMKVGDHFHMRSGKISLSDNTDFCLYAMQSCIPLLPAKQRPCHPADWMETDARVMCPDPECGLVMRIERNDLRVLDHDEVSPIPWESIDKENKSNPNK